MNQQQAQAKADILKALAHPIRLALVEQLAKGEQCVCDLADLVSGERTSVSKHLSILKNAGIISDTRRGVSIYYQLDVPCILQFLGCMEAVLQNKARKAEMALGN